MSAPSPGFARRPEGVQEDSGAARRLLVQLGIQGQRHCARCGLNAPSVEHPEIHSPARHDPAWRGTDFPMPQETLTQCRSGVVACRHRIDITQHLLRFEALAAGSCDWVERPRIDKNPTTSIPHGLH